MKIGLCDDQEIFLNRLGKIMETAAKQANVKMVIQVFHRASDLLEYCKYNKDLDIVVLDIVMDINGIEVAKRIRERNNYIKIVFFSNYEHFAVQGYTVKATRYLLKTDSEKKLVEAVKELLEDCQKERGKVFLEQIGSRVIPIPFSGVMYVETYTRKTKLHTRTGEYISNKNMKGHTNILTDMRFGRCHAAYMVNMDYIKEIRGLELLLDNGEIIGISKGKRKAFMEQYLQYMNSLLR